jgi:two-component system CheB/CheR fusion protein
MSASDCELCRRGILAVVAHELRTPLAALSNSLYVLKRSEPRSDKAQRAAAVMERQVARLSTLITSLTDAARLDHGKLELRRTTLDLCQALRSAARDHEDLFIGHDIELRLRIPEQPIFVSADLVRLDEILRNLLDNAVRFTPRGGRVLLALECDDGAGRARIRVQDTGVGLDSAMRQQLFQPFRQADTSHARRQGGLGLGLALVKGLVELHGGAVTGESDGPGLGSVFTVELPLSGPPPASVVASR